MSDLMLAVGICIGALVVAVAVSSGISRLIELLRQSNDKRRGF